MAGLVGYVLIANTTPLDVRASYGNDAQLVQSLGPKNRIQADDTTVTQTNDLVYLNSKMPLDYDTADISLEFKNPNNQLLYLGYRDANEWHYAARLIDAPVVNGLTWERIGNGPYLYQRVPKYQSVSEFLDTAPLNSAIGTLDYEPKDLLQKDPQIPGYTPAATDTVITTPLRGKVTAYVYLENEPFRMNITTRNLNWYEDPDPTNVTVERQGDTVFSKEIPDDGNTSDDHTLGPEQTTEVKNTGSGLPEPGVYKVVIDQPGDTIVTKISTNLHKIVFAGPLYVAGNNSVYKGLLPATTPTIITTDARNLSVQTYHGTALQTVSAGPQTSVTLAQPNTPYELTLPNDGQLHTVTAPKSDVQINGVGSFAFSPEQFFVRSAYRRVEVEDTADLAHVDYLLTNYRASEPLANDWRRANAHFELADAIITKNQLSWLLQSPKLKANNASITYRSISMDLFKAGWWR